MGVSKSWFAVTVIPNEPGISNERFDELCSDLVCMGAAGTAVQEVPEITCYLEGTEEVVDAFIKKIASIGCSAIAQSRVVEENWTGACPEVWEPIKAGVFEIIPVESLTDQRPAAAGAIKIIPGLGFGTGHHSTTRMVLQALSNLLDTTSKKHYSVLDLGTGSGILAIAAATALGVPITAIDIDPAAIENARDNAALNGVDSLVTLSTTPLSEISGPYNLILANLYGEVLMNLARDVTRVAEPGAIAILSGITEIVWDQVWDTYRSNHGWKLVSEHSDGDWMCAVITR